MAEAKTSFLSVIPNDHPLPRSYPLQTAVPSPPRTLTLEGQISDAEDTPHILQFSLSLTLMGLCPNPRLIESPRRHQPQSGPAQTHLDRDRQRWKKGADSIGLTVNDVNTEPTCGITAPLTGETFTEGPIAFAGTVEDIDQDADGLDIQGIIDRRHFHPDSATPRSLVWRPICPRCSCHHSHCDRPRWCHLRISST